MISYDSVIAAKAKSTRFPGVNADGIVAGHLFPYQNDLTRWALRRGRAAIFADTGLGKTAMQIEWARHVSDRGRVLILAPLAVASQTEREAARWAVNVTASRTDTGARIIVTNYENLHHFDPAAFVGVVLDESSILKSFTGATRTALIDAFKDTPYRLCATATPAPNDFTELGNHSEFLGIKTRTEMLAEYFVHDMDQTQDWRIKGHAVTAFWRWVATWGAVVRAPSDLGYDDSAHKLPPLLMHEHVVPVDHTLAHATGMLFATNAVSLDEQRAVRRSTVDARADIVAKLANEPGSMLVWCELNSECDAVMARVPDAVEVRGSDDAELKTAMLNNFSLGKIRVMVSKPSIAGFGMNWQHCARMAFMGASHSYEQTYQAIRRCWRFGQTRTVDVHVVRAETEQLIIDNYRRKEADAVRMGAEMASHVIDSVRAEVRGASAREWNPYEPRARMVIPKWLKTEAV